MEDKVIDKQYIISLNKFIFLSIISFGTYQIYWIYKSWKFFKQKDGLDIIPILKVLLFMFYINSLFEKIITYSEEKKYEMRYSSGALTYGLILINLSVRLPEPYWLLNIFSFIFIIPPFKALNFAKRNSTEFEVIEQYKFNWLQISLIVLGTIFWITLILWFIIKD